MNLLSEPPVIDYNQQKWLEYKYSVLSKLECKFPKYDMIIFGKNNMKAEFSLSEKGLCLINVGIGKGEKPTEYFAEVAMVDTGSSHSVVSKDFADRLHFEVSETHRVVKGFDGMQMVPSTIISMMCHELELIAPIPVAVVQHTPDGVDLVLGADFLKGFIFTRNGIDKTFTLEM